MKTMMVKVIGGCHGHSSISQKVAFFTLFQSLNTVFKQSQAHTSTLHRIKITSLKHLNDTV